VNFCSVFLYLTVSSNGEAVCFRLDTWSTREVLDHVAHNADELIGDATLIIDESRVPATSQNGLADRSSAKARSVRKNGYAMHCSGQQVGVASNSREIALSCDHLGRQITSLLVSVDGSQRWMVHLPLRRGRESAPSAASCLFFVSPVRFMVRSRLVWPITFSVMAKARR